MTRSGKIVLVILAALNIVLLVQNYFLRKNEKSSYDKYEMLKGELYEFGGKGKLLNPLTHLYNNIELLPATKNVNANEVFLLVIIDDHGCPACIEHHVKRLNEFPDRLKPYVSVVYDGLEKNYLESFKPSFEYQVMKPGEIVFSKSMDYPKPLAFFIVDKQVYILHRTETASNKKTDLFYNRVVNLLDKIYIK